MAPTTTTGPTAYRFPAGEGADPAWPSTPDEYTPVMPRDRDPARAPTTTGPRQEPR